VEDFLAEADRHPVFELIPAGQDRQHRHRGTEEADAACGRAQPVTVVLTCGRPSDAANSPIANSRTSGYKAAAMTRTGAKCHR
jgi:hypothetical protein